MNQPRSLDDIVKAMEAIERVGDKEQNHMAADDLLIEALYWFKSFYGHDSAVNALIDAYNLIEKWYA